METPAACIWFTPARVRKTAHQVRCHRRVLVHPHACGGETISSSTRRARGGQFTPTRVGKTSLTCRCGPSEVVHPHACGEDLRLVQREANSGSPHACGETQGVPAAASTRSSTWFTPTRVGKTSSTKGRAERLTGSPHACGEDGSPSAASPGGCSSPTRVGRDVVRRDRARGAYRFTHACGEDVGTLGAALVAAGSPPRVWGRLQSQLAILTRPPTVHPHACGVCGTRHGLHGRFTPTRVGRHPLVLAHQSADQFPHACGEDTLTLTRGGRVEVHPTRVGKTSTVAMRLSSTTVHPPRVWGKPPPDGGSGQPYGSPPRVWGRPSSRAPAVRFWRFTPRVWGRQSWRSVLGRGRRFTPTRVGKTTLAPGGLWAALVHPHACGDVVLLCVSHLTPGSPPRVWGRPPFPSEA